LFRSVDFINGAVTPAFIQEPKHSSHRFPDEQRHGICHRQLVLQTLPVWSPTWPSIPSRWRDRPAAVRRAGYRDPLGYSFLHELRRHCALHVEFDHADASSTGQGDRHASVLASGAAAEIGAERPTPNARAGREPVPGAEADRRAYPFADDEERDEHLATAGFCQNEIINPAFRASQPNCFTE
jgi:hypothetical protein